MTFNRIFRRILFGIYPEFIYIKNFAVQNDKKIVSTLNVIVVA